MKMNSFYRGILEEKVEYTRVDLKPLISYYLAIKENLLDMYKEYVRYKADLRHMKGDDAKINRGLKFFRLMKYLFKLEYAGFSIIESDVHSKCKRFHSPEQIRFHKAEDMIDI